MKRVDTLEFTPRLYRKAYSEGYVKLAEKAPELYAHAFRKTDTKVFIAGMTRWRRLGARAVTRKFLQFVEAFAPEVVICPHFLPLEAMGVYGAKHPNGPRVVCVVTDFEAHALWMEPAVDLYCVATPESKARLAARGISPRAITVTGIPVSQRFLHPRPAALLRKEQKLHPKLATLLVLAGGLGMGPLVETAASEIDKSGSARSRWLSLPEKMRRCGKSWPLKRFVIPMHVFGFVSNMQDLMTAADLIVTKPGGLTTSEALALGKPLLIVNPLPGQEAANSTIFSSSAAPRSKRTALRTRRTGWIAHVLDAATLRRMSLAAAALGKPQAADAVCRAVDRLLRR